MGIAREVWGSHNNSHDYTPFSWDREEALHKDLHGLLRTTRKINPDTLETHGVKLSHISPLHHAFGVVPDGRDQQGPWEDFASQAYAHKRPPISDKVRALIHNPGVAADALEEEGHENLAHKLRSAELVHTYHGSDAEYPDAMFMHNGKVHLVVRGNRTPTERYHYVLG